LLDAVSDFLEEDEEAEGGRGLRVWCSTSVVIIDNFNEISPVIKANRSMTEEVVFSVLKAILPERLPTSNQLLANYPNLFNPESWIPFQLS